MTHTFVSNDVQLTHGDIRQLQNADAVAGFFARLHYSIDQRLTLTPQDIGLDGHDLRYEIRHVELLATDPHDEDIKIYLLEVRALTAKLRNAIARAFRNRSEQALFVLTSNYETLEFVLFIRELAASLQRGTILRQVIRPVPLTIHRANVANVALRVLKRLTMTEPDALYQWDKLRSAFVLAEWSEEYFNNRALFSDYYLNYRLTDPKLNAEWDDDVLSIGRKINPLIKTARKTLTDQPLATMQKQFYAPILNDLGFVTHPVAGEPAYRYDLSLPNNPQPVAAFFGYVWNRNLDDQDTQRDTATSMIIPGAEVVSTLEAGNVPWVIVSNGKYWRLYSTTASNKATNYYEVDLEEAFGAQDALKALKYWWLFFRAAAFDGFLDRMLKQSAEYAKGLGERLKDRVFTEIFPQFAQGFIADMRRQGINDISAQQLNTVFEGTLTFLYRLMFVLYAESLDLLPLNEHNGYRERSLYTIKQELATVGETLLDQRQAKLQAAYSESSTALYQRILALCAVIDRGSPDLNMPTYNGGLFSPNTVSGQFLQTYAVPDRYLALGLDRLARDLDDRSQALVLIDFKSLGVRQLGSIYEGLLEFKLHIASERLAVTKEKGKEVYQPVAKVAKPLALIEPGMAYLVNDKKERKATGSYYTPDYIVKYIVQQTVGAVLDEKFKLLAPRLHAAQKQYRDYAKLVAARAKSSNLTSNRPETASVFWTDPNNAMIQLLDDCLNVRVLDPAMGSGHFLVEVVDFISNRLIHFLNAWSENPVWALIDRTRNEIVADMERQGVTIDSERLTRVALLKRAVLKRCIYGVDLNAMAVELAKVSLWLDAFTLGAPLSFLDHHLKHGNSLIGARINDVEKYLNTQMHMSSNNEFAGLSLATDLMRQVSFLSDNTVEQAQQSAVAFREAHQHLAPFKRRLDVYLSRWFSNKQPKKSSFDPIHIFLGMAEVKPWFNDPTIKIITQDKWVEVNKIAQSSLIDSDKYRFFHWELEFPEIFFAPSTPGSQDIRLNPNGGFDAVVGNPPYSSKLSLETTEFMPLYNLVSYKGDLFAFFVEKMLQEVKGLGRIGIIIPSSILSNIYYQDLRKNMINNRLINEIILFDGLVFSDANIDTMILNISKDNFENGKFLIGTSEIGSIKGDFNEIYFDSVELFNRYEILPNFSQRWIDLHKKIMNFSLYMKDIMKTSLGIKLESNDKFISNIDDSLHQEPIVFGDNIYRYNFVSPSKFFNYEKSNIIGGTKNKSIHTHKPKIFIQAIRNLSLKRRLITTVDNNGYYFIGTLNASILKNDEYSQNINIYYIQSCLASSFINSYFSKRFVTMSITSSFIDEVPIRRIKFTTEPAERERLTKAAIDHYQARDYPQVLAHAQQVLAAEQSDVVHDLLAYLAQQMIDLNKAKQKETKRFLGWLESQLRIQPKKGETGIDSLTGKTFIQGYLGDYQKGQRAVSWGDFWYRLHQNRNRFASNLSELESSIAQSYRQSLDILLPIKADLARTDALIDKIVYRLYGLSVAEIELIERPQYEQALSEAKANVLKELGTATSDEQTDAIIDKIAEEILPAAERFFERVEPISIEATLDTALPNWRTLPPEIPTFLRTGEYSLLMADESMDFSVSIIPFTKAVETLLHETIFKPFRDESGFSATNCENKFLIAFIKDGKHLTLGSYPIILASSKEQALRSFVNQRFGNRNVFGVGGLVALLNNQAMLKLRNKAAHDEVISRSEAEQVREWALNILSI